MNAGLNSSVKLSFGQLLPGGARDAESRKEQLLVLAAAGLLFAGIFALRLGIDNEAEGITVLYTIPIALIAIAFGSLAGIAAAALGLALFGVWAAIDGVEVGVLGVISRAICFLLLGGLLGRFAEQLNAAIETARDQQYELQEILDNATAIIYLKDTDGRYMRVNRQFEQLFNVSKEEVTGKTDYDVFPRYMADAFRANDRHVLRAQTPLELEEIAPHHDGNHTYISIKFPLFGADGNPYGVCGISTDITERKRVERNLKEGKDRVQEIIDAAHEAFVSMDQSGVITTWNRAAEATFGWPRAKALGRPLVDTIIPPRYREAHRKGLAKFLSSGEGPLLNKRIEIDALHRDGHELRMEMTVTPMRVHGGGYTFNAFLQDIGKRKKVEDAATKLGALDRDEHAGAPVEPAAD
jgi:PAS domain S-box-containing protein